MQKAGAQGTGLSDRDIAVDAPLGSEQEIRSFHETYDGSVGEAAKGTIEDRQNAVELLKQRAAAARVSPGEKRLLLLAVLDLIKATDAPDADSVVFSQRTLLVLEGQSIVLASARIQVLSDMASRSLPADVRPSPTGWARNILQLRGCMSALGC